MSLSRTLLRWPIAVAATMLVGTAAVAAAAPAVAAPPTGDIRAAGGAGAIPGSYIVVLKAGRSAPASARAGLVRGFGAALNGFEAKLSEAAARRLAADPAVAFVEQNHTVSVAATQTNPPSWGLDRIDQRSLPLNQSYTFPTTASTVHAYIIDTGILFSHSTFGGRATSGFDAVDGGSADDCNGHGTHVAGTVGGSQYGVAKAVQLVAVRVLNCSGSGTTSGVIAGINWVTQHAIKPAVANMSLGGGASSALDSAVTASINSGVSYAVAAGNSNASACNSSPSRVGPAITVGATTSTDARASFSNFGSCVDIFAPGQGITSAWNTGTTATNTISGTSMASPHAAGAAALVLARNPSFTPAQVRDALVNAATTGVVTNPGSGSPNRLLFVAQ